MISENIRLGLIEHKANNLNLAISHYKKEIDLNPQSADANNLLSVALFDLGRFDEALYHSNIACSNSKSPDFLSNRARILIRLGKFNDAISDLNYAVKHKKSFAEAYNNLCVCYLNLHDYRNAIKYGALALDANPGLEDAHLNLGISYYRNNQFDKSELIFNKLKILNPSLKSEYFVYSLYKSEDFIRAADNAQKMLFDNPSSLDLLFIALDSFTRINNIDCAAKCLQLYESSTSNFDSKFIIYLRQDVFFSALNKTLNYICSLQGGVERVINIYKKLIDLDSEIKHALLVNLGVVYFNLNKFVEAKSLYLKAIELEYRQKWAHNNLGVIEIANGNSNAAIKHFENAIEVDPEFISPLGWILKEKAEICDWGNFNELKARLANLIASNDASFLNGITSLAVYDDKQVLLDVAKRNSYAKFASDGFEVSLPAKNIKTSGKFRIGYYSYDFRDHPVAHLTSRLFKLHDRNKFEVYCYSYGPNDNSEIRDEIIRSSDCFNDVSELSDHEIANIIANHSLDLIIDLSGDTKGNRSSVFKYNIAKKKAHWLGFIGTMGTTCYDYIVADDVVIPPGDERFYSEKILRIEGTFHISNDSRNFDAYQVKKSDYGIPEDFFVFGVNCQTFKIQPEIFHCWMDILKSTENSVLLIAEGPLGSRENLISYAKNVGLDDRLFFAPRVHVGLYLARYKLIDLMLDTFPYTSGTIASDALFGGCPILTMYGTTMASRMCTSILKEAGIDELVTFSIEEYKQRAVELCIDSNCINSIKERLKMLRGRGALLDTKKFVKKYEKALLIAMS